MEQHADRQTDKYKEHKVIVRLSLRHTVIGICKRLNKRASRCGSGHKCRQILTTEELILTGLRSWRHTGDICMVCSRLICSRRQAEERMLV